MWKLLYYLAGHSPSESQPKRRAAAHPSYRSPVPGDRFSPSLEDNLTALRDALGNSMDLVFRTFTIGGIRLRGALVYLDGLVENPSVNDFVLRPLVQQGVQAGATWSERPRHRPTAAEPGAATMPIFRQLQDVLVVNSAIVERLSFHEAVDDILSGTTLLLVDTVPGALSIPQVGYEERGVEEPPTESLIRGPRDGFVESVRINVALLRRRLRDPSLRLERLRIGRRTQTEVVLCYLQDVANPEYVDTIRQRLQRIDIPGVLESGFLEQWIEDHPFSPFPQVQNTERADRAVANLLEGRVVILVDGTPVALILPSVFNQFYQAPEDYYERFLIATLIRAVRVLALFFSLTFTALYVALLSYHAEMLPTKFAVAVAGGRAGVPFPSVAEALIMELMMEVLREAALRLPKPIGPAVSIVGALVIGESAVRAGVVSPLMVVVVALTTIGSFAVPNYSAAIALRIVRFPIILAAGFLGLYGIMLALTALVIHLSALESVGVPYLAPFGPIRSSDMKDALVRTPLWTMAQRPTFLRPQDPTQLPDHRSTDPGEDRRP